jgi:hypothetical protein
MHFCGAVAWRAGTTHAYMIHLTTPIDDAYVHIFNGFYIHPRRGLAGKFWKNVALRPCRDMHMYVFGVPVR